MDKGVKASRGGDPRPLNIIIFDLNGFPNNVRPGSFLVSVPEVFVSNATLLNHTSKEVLLEEMKGSRYERWSYDICENGIQYQPEYLAVLQSEM